MTKQIKVLHVMNGATLGGISTVVLNYYQHIDRTRFRFDCAVNNIKLGPNGNALERLGCEFFHLPLKSRHLVKYCIKLAKLLSTHQYDAIHVHNNMTSFVPLGIAKMYRVPIRIGHAHSAYQKNNNVAYKVKEKIFQWILSKTATNLIGCSNEAAESIFGISKIAKSKTIVLRNAIDAQKFLYDARTSEEMRSSFGIGSELILGTVGNLGSEKNQQYLLRIGSELKNQGIEFKMIIVGEGPLRDELNVLAKELEISDCVLFLGRRTDVPQVLMMFDCFVMPSLYEGFGIAALEAVASGLPVLLSDKIPSDLQVFDNCTYLSIEAPPSSWVEHILQRKAFVRELGVDTVREKGYDIKDNTHVLENLYSIGKIVS